MGKHTIRLNLSRHNPSIRNRFKRTRRTLPVHVKQPKLLKFDNSMFSDPIEGLKKMADFVDDMDEYLLDKTPDLRDRLHMLVSVVNDTLYTELSTFHNELATKRNATAVNTTVDDLMGKLENLGLH
jgi:hypothetical protein